MSALDLVVDSVDNAAAYGDDATSQKKGQTPSTWIGSVIHKGKQPPPRSIWAGNTGYSEAKVATILRGFLQPDAKTSLRAMAKSLLVLTPANSPGNAEVYSFGEIRVEQAEQVPYYHPSQQKLTQLLHCLAQSPKFMYKDHFTHKTKFISPFSSYENLSAIVYQSLKLYPLYLTYLNAFMANMYATGVWGTSPGKALTVMRSAFETAKAEDTWEQDCNTMAAAQWILWHGQNLFKLIIYDHLVDNTANDGNWWLGKELEGCSMGLRFVERWRFWKTGFETVGNALNVSDECKKPAAKTALLMGSIENSMLL